MLNQPFIFKGPHIINMNLHAVINYKNKLKVARVPIRTSRKVYFVAESIFINVLPNVPWFFFLKHERNVYSGDYGPVHRSEFPSAVYPRYYIDMAVRNNKKGKSPKEPVR